MVQCWGPDCAKWNYPSATSCWHCDRIRCPDAEKLIANHGTPATKQQPMKLTKVADEGLKMANGYLALQEQKSTVSSLTQQQFQEARAQRKADYELLLESYNEMLAKGIPQDFLTSMATKMDAILETEKQETLKVECLIPESVVTQMTNSLESLSSTYEKWKANKVKEINAKQHAIDEAETKMQKELAELDAGKQGQIDEFERNKLIEYQRLLETITNVRQAVHDRHVQSMQQKRDSKITSQQQLDAGTAQYAQHTAVLNKVQHIVNPVAPNGATSPQGTQGPPGGEQASESTDKLVLVPPLPLQSVMPPMPTQQPETTTQFFSLLDQADQEMDGEEEVDTETKRELDAHRERMKRLQKEARETEVQDKMLRTKIKEKKRAKEIKNKPKEEDKKVEEDHVETKAQDGTS